MCKSDSNGGAAIVSRRLTEALRQNGVDATLLVADKTSDEDFAVKASYPLRKPLAFLMERMEIFTHNGFSRKNLFKTDTASFGLPLWNHPIVKGADAVILNWVNQGMLSLKGVRRICAMGKRVVWTMHDMWNLTGICHHAMDCRNFEKKCGNCFYLGKKSSPEDLSYRIHHRKEALYDDCDIKFVAVSRWLAKEAAKSSLLKDRKIEPIHNPFETIEDSILTTEDRNGFRVMFSAASIDNWIKGLSTLRKAAGIIASTEPELAGSIELVFMGGLRNTEVLSDFPLQYTYLGKLSGEKEIADAFHNSDVTVNCSHFENLPTTLIEGQAYGSIPVAFDRGGQADIIDHLSTGFLASWDDDEEKRAANLAQGIIWALRQTARGCDDIKARMRENVERKFSYSSVAKRYIELLQA